MKISLNRLFWHQAWIVAQANIKSRYRGTVTGFFWVLLNPLMQYFAQGFIFKMVLNIQVENYWIFLLAGLLPWIFIVQSFEICTTVFYNSGAILKAYQVNPMIFIVAQIFDNFVNFIVAFFAVLLLLSAYFPVPFWKLIFLPMALLPLLLFVSSCSLILATVFVFFRDLKFVISFVLNIVYFLTPIFYPLSLVPAQYQWIIKINPIYWMIVPFQTLLSNVDLAAFFSSIYLALGLSIMSAVLAILIWRSRRNMVLFYV